MSSRFYNALELERFRSVLITGIGNREQLVSQLGKECIQHGRKTLITSDAPMIFPPEGQFQVSKDYEFLLKKATEKSYVGQVYLAKDLEEERLLPFETTDLLQLYEQLPKEMMLLMTFDSRNKDLVDELFSHEDVLILCMIDFEPIRGDILDITWDNSNGGSQLGEHVLQHIYQVMNAICSLEKWTKRQLQFAMYINRVNDIFDENLFIPIGRNLKQKGVQTVLFGSLQDYVIKSL